jgi:hypothetical protein
MHPHARPRCPPLLPSGYYKDIVQFSRGEYPDANELEDDLQVISGFIPNVQDDHGNSIAAATAIPSGAPPAPSSRPL